MPKIEIPNLSEDTYRRITEGARSRGMSLAQEAEEILARGIATSDADEAQLLAEIRTARDLNKELHVTEADIQTAKRCSRE